MNDSQFYFALYLCLINLALTLTASYYRDRARRLLRERDLSRDYAAILETKYNEALFQLGEARRQLEQRLVLHGHVPDPANVPVHKYTVLVTNGYTPEGAFVVLTISSDQPRVLPRALAAVVVNAPPLPQPEHVPRH
jgi:hypothetical protein